MRTGGGWFGSFWLRDRVTTSRGPCMIRGSRAQKSRRRGGDSVSRGRMLRRALGFEVATGRTPHRGWPPRARPRGSGTALFFGCNSVRDDPRVLSKASGPTFERCLRGSHSHEIIWAATSPVFPHLCHGLADGSRRACDRGVGVLRPDGQECRGAYVAERKPNSILAFGRSAAVREGAGVVEREGREEAVAGRTLGVARACRRADGGSAARRARGCFGDRGDERLSSAAAGGSCGRSSGACR